MCGFIFELEKPWRVDVVVLQLAYLQSFRHWIDELLVHSDDDKENRDRSSDRDIVDHRQRSWPCPNRKVCQSDLA